PDRTPADPFAVALIQPHSQSSTPRMHQTRRTERQSPHRTRRKTRIIDTRDIGKPLISRNIRDRRSVNSTDLRFRPTDQLIVDDAFAAPSKEPPPRETCQKDEAHRRPTVLHDAARHHFTRNSSMFITVFASIVQAACSTTGIAGSRGDSPTLSSE